MKWKIVGVEVVDGAFPETRVTLRCPLAQDVAEAVEDIDDAIASRGYAERYHKAIREVLGYVIEAVESRSGKPMTSEDRDFIAEGVYRGFGLDKEGRRVA